MASARFKTLFANKFIFGLLASIAVMISSLAHADEDYLSVEVADPYIELHTGAGRGYPIFYIAERGEHVDVLKQRTDWIKVRVRTGTLREKEGWVSIDQMSRTLTADGEHLNVAYPDFEAYKKRRWEMGLMYGTFAKTNSVSAYGGFHLTQNISAEIEASQYFGNFSNGKIATVNAVLQPFPEWRLSPFVTLGYGRVWVEPKSTLVQTTDRDHDVVDAGVGVRYYFTRRFFLRAQYKNYEVLTNSTTNQNAEEWKIGFSVFF
ncbi:MAG: outer membrane beta-barrel protein [Spongiibacteraceae bacterium]